MSYMAQQAVTTAIRDAFRDRDDALGQAATAAEIRAWLEGLPLGPAMLATIVEPIAAIETGLRDADRRRRAEGPGAAGAPGA